MADSILPSLDAIQARADEYETQRQRFDSHLRDIAAHESAADVPVLVAALRAVLDLHRPEAWRGTNVLVCAHCRPAWTGSNRATYPCETVRAVTAHIDTTPKEKP